VLVLGNENLFFKNLSINWILFKEHRKFELKRYYI